MLEGDRPLQQALQASMADTTSWQQSRCSLDFGVPTSCGHGSYSLFYKKELDEQLHIISGVTDKKLRQLSRWQR